MRERAPPATPLLLGHYEVEEWARGEEDVMRVRTSEHNQHAALLSSACVYVKIQVYVRRRRQLYVLYM